MTVMLQAGFQFGLSPTGHRQISVLQSRRVWRQRLEQRRTEREMHQRY